MSRDWVPRAIDEINAITEQEIRSARIRDVKSGTKNSPIEMNMIFEPLTEEELSFANVVKILYDQRFTGAITIHFKDGKASVVDFPAPKIKLTT